MKNPNNPIIIKGMSTGLGELTLAEVVSPRHEPELLSENAWTMSVIPQIRHITEINSITKRMIPLLFS